jgi:acyl carrier protein|tara:strand:+ start:414 stop:752 length:339 start_codon:yes stop_codon:yes gene_type:complete
LTTCHKSKNKINKKRKAMMNVDTIFNKLVNEVIPQAIDFEDYDITEKFTLQTALVGDDSIEIDSVDLLELAITIQREFDFRVEELNSALFDQHFSSIASLVEFISAQLGQKK